MADETTTLGAAALAGGVSSALFKLAEKAFAFWRKDRDEDKRAAAEAREEARTAAMFTDLKLELKHINSKLEDNGTAHTETRITLARIEEQGRTRDKRLDAIEAQLDRRKG